MVYLKTATCLDAKNYEILFRDIFYLVTSLENFDAILYCLYL